jgi:hypothetical protein
VAAVVAAVVAWGGLIGVVAVSVARPEDPNSGNGCLDICIAPPAWVVLDLLLAAVTVVAALFGLFAGWLAKYARPDGPGRVSWRACLVALAGLVVTWLVLAATGPHD